MAASANDEVAALTDGGQVRAADVGGDRWLFLWLLAVGGSVWPGTEQIDGQVAALADGEQVRTVANISVPPGCWLSVVKRMCPVF